MAERTNDNPTKTGEQRKLAAVMFTDIVAYSSMMHKDEADALEFLAAHNSIVKEQVAAHGGRVIKAIGDSLMVDFKSVVDAVNCAVAIQTRFHKRNRGQSKDQQRFIRVGIHLGDVVVTKDDIFGDGVNIASRLVPLSPHGGICVTREVETHLRGMRSLKVRHWGVRFLKNIPRPVEVFQVWAAGMDPAAASRFQFLRGKGPRFLSVAIIALVLGLALVPRWLEKRDLGGWEPWLVEDFKDWKGFSERWQVPDPSAGREGWLVLKKPVPSRAFRVKALYRVPVGGRCDVTLAALVLGKEGDFLFYRRKADPRLKWISDQVGLRREGELEDEAIGSWAGGTSEGLYWQTLLFDSGRLTAKAGNDGWLDRFFPGRKALTTWVRHAPAGAIFRFALRTGEAKLERLEIDFREVDGDGETAERADAYALAGRTDTALKLYDELIDREDDAEGKCGYLYRQALVRRAAGDKSGALDIYYKILKTFPENLYSGCARLDLGLYEGGEAQAADQEKESRRHAEQAHGYFSGLLKRQPHHPDAALAAYLMAKNDLEHLGAGPDARQAALDIVRSGGPYSMRALQALLDAPTSSKDTLTALEPLVRKAKLKGPLLEKAAGAVAESFRLSNRTTDLATLVEKACRSGKFTLGAREAVVKQWVLAEGTGLSESRSKALAERLDERGKAGTIFERVYLRAEGEAMSSRAWEALRDAVKVEFKDAGERSPKRREFLDWVQGEFRIRGGAPGTAVLPREEGGGLKMTFKGGSPAMDLVMEPGVGPFSLEADEEGRHRAVDVRIFRKITFKAKFPKGAEVRLKLAEPAAGDPDALAPQGRGGTDGEQYELATFTGAGDWKRYQADLKNAEPDLTWGNQEGDLKLSLGKLGAVVLSIGEIKKKGELELKDLLFER